MTTDAGPQDLFDRALDQASRLIKSTRPDQLTLPTPCTGWDVQALLSHLAGTPRVFAALARGERVNPTAPQTDAVRDGYPDTLFRQGRDELESALREHPERAPRYRSLIVGETAIHAWDLAEATGQTAHLDPAIAEAALVQLRERLTPEARANSTAFGPEIPVADDAPPYLRLAGFLGRRPPG
ncbi:MAG: TIGR03086 family metal-binding protein [Candidatus Dormibacteria bacterium]